MRQKKLKLHRRQASNLVARTRAQIDALMEEMEPTAQAKKFDSGTKSKIESGYPSSGAIWQTLFTKRKEDYVPPRPLKIGDTVLIFDIDKQATVIGLSKNSDQVEVQAGIMKTRVPLLICV